MPTVIINDVELEARVGEKLLSVARRNAAHIGFVCDGNGLCQTCQCRVLSGTDQLSPPSEAELAWMPPRRLAEGHRLACQTVIRGSGPVRLISKAEELRRQTRDVLLPRRDELSRDNLEPLLYNLASMAADQLIRYPWNALAAFLRVGPVRFFYPIRDEERYADDLSRTIRRTQSGIARLPRDTSAEQAERRLAAAARQAAAMPPEPGTAVPASATARLAAMPSDPDALVPPPPEPVPLPPAHPAASVEERVREAARALRRASADLRRLAR
jgi:ferredoxin